MSTAFKQDEVFPLIFALIVKASNGSIRYLTQQQIATLLRVCHPKYVSTAAESSKLAPGRMATNMVAWFSQKFTLGTNCYQLKLERTKLGRTWAYRSVQLAASAPKRGNT